MHLYTHRPELLPTLVREASFCSGQWLIQRFVSVLRVEDVWLLSVHPLIGHLHQPFQVMGNVTEEGAERI